MNVLELRPGDAGRVSELELHAGDAGRKRVDSRGGATLGTSPIIGLLCGPNCITLLRCVLIFPS